MNPQMQIQQPDLFVYPKPFCKWAGGKGKLLKQIAPHFPKHYNRYWEPFLGSGAVFFSLLPQRAVISDVNEELILTYQVIRDQVDDLIDTLCRMAVRFQDKSEYYYSRIRSLDPRTLCSIDVAARFIFLNKTCFNGLYRVNSLGLFNVPKGTFKTPSVICDADNLRAVSKALQSADIYCRHYDWIEPDADDFVYLDPPYYGTYSQYSSEGFTEADHLSLAADYHYFTTRKGVKVALSNSDCEFVRDIYSDYRIIEVQRSGSMNSNISDRGKVGELLILNY